MEIGLDYVDVFLMWKYIYLFNSYDVHGKGAFYPDDDIEEHLNY